MAKLYENIFKGKFGALYARTFDTETETSKISSIKFVPSFYLETTENTQYKSILTKKNLREQTFKTMKDYRDAVKMYKSQDVVLYGNRSQEQGYIRENWPQPTSCDHKFHYWALDIETMVDIEDPNHDKKLDWKSNGSERSSMAIISSIQIYDSKSKQFYILSYKDWDRNSFKDIDKFEKEYGTIKYIKQDSEEDLLKTFLTILSKRNPTAIFGWNSFGYDFPYITNRIIRKLDGRNDLFYYDKQKHEWRFNTDTLEGGYVKQLSPIGMISHKEVQTNFGLQDDFVWEGYFMEDYLELYKKYTYTTHTSYSLSTVAGYELGDDKINHDEFSDFGEFYRKDFNKFIEYGIKDTSLLRDLDNKLKLLDLAKFIAYSCGVNISDIHGTMKQWNSFMFNRAKDENLLLPLESHFPEKDTFLLKHAMQMNDLSTERKQFFGELYGDPELHGQSFAGGWTRGTARFWKWVFSLDYTSLYPSAIMWANIGIDTLIEPKDLPQDLLDIRAKYFIYYPKNVESKHFGKFDLKFIEEVLRKPEVVEEIRAVLLKHNVTATPNGMFFRREKRAIASQIMEDMITQRKVHKKEMREAFQAIEDIKAKEFYADGDKDELAILSSLADKENVYQMGIKILINSYYGSLSMKAAVSAGQSEYFSTAITSVGRIANIFVGQEQCMKVAEITGKPLSETKYGAKTRLDHIAQADTDSVYLSIEEVIKKKFGEDYAELESTPEGKERLIEFTLNYINKIAMPLCREKLDGVYAYAMNAHLPEKLTEDPEVICDNFISIAPKMYFARKYWDEGVTYAKPKLKITGLSTVRASTPKFFRPKLRDAMEILIDGNIPEVIKFCEQVADDTRKQKPSEICINQGVSNMDYQWDEIQKKFRRWVPDKQKWLSAPMNSRASLIHNKYINDNKIQGIKDIDGGDKIGFIELKVPNKTASNVIAFQNEKIFDHGLKEFIDYDTMYNKGFMKPIHLITGPIGWNLDPEPTFDEDEW